MKRGAGTLLASILVLGFATYVYFGEFKKGQEEEKKKEQDSLLLPGLPSDQIAHVEWWTGPNQGFVVDKKDGVWTLTVPRPKDDPSHAITDRASGEQVENFLKKLLQTRSTETVVKGAFDEKTFGLDMPMFEIKLADPTSSDLHTLRIGSVKAYDASLYAQIDNAKAVYLAPNGMLELFKKEPVEFRERSLYREPATKQWREIIVSRDGKVVLDLQKKERAWAAIGDDKLQLDTAAVDAYLKRLEKVLAVDFTYEGTSLKPFKLDHPYLLVQLKDEKGLKWEMRLTNAKDASADSPAGSMQASVMATATNVPAVVKVLDQNLKIIDKRAEDFVRAPKPSATPTPKGNS